MTKRPTSLTILAAYFLIVFGLSLLMSIVAAAQELAPYTRGEWMILTVPKVLGVTAGIALWRMLKIAAGLWFVAVLLGWAIAIGLNTGFFPSLTIASAVSAVIVGFSIWAFVKNWYLLRPLGERSIAEHEAAE